MAEKQREYRARRKTKRKVAEAKGSKAKTSTTRSTSGVKQYEGL